jgi:hypothetical protein
MSAAVLPPTAPPPLPTPPTLDPIDLQPAFPPPNFFPTKGGPEGGEDNDDDSGHAESFITAHSDDVFPRPPVDVVLVANPTSSSFPPSESSSFVDRRWDSIVLHNAPSPGLQTGSSSTKTQSDVLLLYKLESMAAEEKKKQKQKQQASSMFALKDVQVTRTCVLFGLGFVAPWCWLIGGWMPDASHRKVRRGSNGGGGFLLPLWRDKENKQPFGGWFGLGYPFVAPSVKVIPEAPMLRLKPQFESAAVGKETDPWVYPCRVAALTSGCLLLVALVVLTVFLVRNRW